MTDKIEEIRREAMLDVYPDDCNTMILLRAYDVEVTGRQAAESDRDRLRVIVDKIKRILPDDVIASAVEEPPFPLVED